jgi:hypothetical protein
MSEVKDVLDFDESWYASASGDEQKMFREWLLGVLKMHDPVEISFYKKDGTVREMKCTLKEGTAPSVENPKTSDTLCTVWDSVLGEWRSFHFDKIKTINFVL